MKNYQSILLLASLSTLALGCTGKPDDSDDSASDDTGSADSTAPTVLETTPADDEQDVALNRAVRVLFSEPLASSTVTASSFTMTTDGSPIAGSVSYSDSDGAATFTPDASLPIETVFEVTLTTALTDVAGNPLAADAVFHFTSGAAADLTAPRVTATTPLDGAMNMAFNGTVTVTFDEPIDPLSVGPDAFLLTLAGLPVPGSFAFVDNTAIFTPLDLLPASTRLDAEIAAGILDLAGNPLRDAYLWSFTTSPSLVLPVNLGTAANFAILAKSGISTVPASAITGDIGVSPAAATYITGFSLIADSTNVYSISTQVVGEVYAADYEVPTPSNMTTAISDMETAFVDAAGRPAGITELGAGNIGGLTIAPGVYKWGTGVLIPTDVTLSGSATDIWIFQIAQDLTMSTGARVSLTGGALAKNVYWQVSGLVDINTTAHCEGVVLTSTSVTLQTGASINGRLLAQTAVNLDAATVVEPAP
jgi:hypothetical protein